MVRDLKYAAGRFVRLYIVAALVTLLMAALFAADNKPFRSIFDRDGGFHESCSNCRSQM